MTSDEATRTGARGFPLPPAPLLMRLGGAFAVVYCLGALVLLIGGFVGALPYVIDTQEVTREQWLAVATPLFAITIVLMAVIAYGLLRRRAWSRHAVMAHWVAVFAYGVFLWTRGTVAPSIALRVMAESGILGAFAAWYFYRKPNVVAYFRSLHEPESTSSVL